MKKRSKNTNIYDKINLRNRKKRANIHTLTTKLIYEIEKKRKKQTKYKINNSRLQTSKSKQNNRVIFIRELCLTIVLNLQIFHPKINIASMWYTTLFFKCAPAVKTILKVSEKKAI